jgi:hypothetical protein
MLATYRSTSCHECDDASSRWPGVVHVEDGSQVLSGAEPSTTRLVRAELLARQRLRNLSRQRLANDMGGPSQSPIVVVLLHGLSSRCRSRICSSEEWLVI